METEQMQMQELKNDTYIEEQQKLKGIKILSIWSLVLWVTLIFSFVGLILSIIAGIQILTTDWQDEKLRDSKTLWGILTLVILGPIASLIFSIQS